MKKSILFIATLSYMFSCTQRPVEQVEVGDKTSIEYSKLKNVGDVGRGEIINTVIEVKNTGESPLIIGEVIGTCSCTVPNWTKEPVMPGSVGRIQARIDSKNFPEGKFTKIMRFSSNTEPFSNEITITGAVKI